MARRTVIEYTKISAYNYLTSLFCRTRQNVFETSGFVRVDYTSKWNSVRVHVDYVRNFAKPIHSQRNFRYTNRARISISTKIRFVVYYNVFKPTSRKIRHRSLSRGNKIQKSLQTKRDDRSNYLFWVRAPRGGGRRGVVHVAVVVIETVVIWFAVIAPRKYV